MSKNIHMDLYCVRRVCKPSKLCIIIRAKRKKTREESGTVPVANAPPRKEGKKKRRRRRRRRRGQQGGTTEGDEVFSNARLTDVESPRTYLFIRL